jgi:hypothetical protein
MPTGPGDQGDEHRRRRTLIGSVVAVAVVVLGVAGIVLGDSLGGEDDEPTSSPSRGTTSPTDTESTDLPLQAPVVPDGAIVVPVDNEGRRELAIVTTPGQQRSLPQIAGIPDLPSISPGGTFVEFRITNPDGTSSMVVGPDERVRSMIRGDVPDGARCEGRVAWAPTNHDVAVACFTADDKRTVYTGTVDDLGQMQGSEMQPLEAFSGWEALKHVTYTHSGGLAVAVVLGDADLGLYYVGPEASEPRRLTSGRDSDSAGSPVDDRIVFQRAGDLYLTTAGKTPLDCKGRSEPDAVITGTELCLLMPNAPEGTADSDPTFAADGQSIAFVRTSPELSTTLMTLALTGTEPQPVQVEGGVSGAPSWGPR